ncbi:MAG: flagellar hook-length control protein FliK, partial [Deltaproteobacteria bacterium]|nr:flagellar hook-length control protein FliK [Deltaproteobacteria bacterium]
LHQVMASIEELVSQPASSPRSDTNEVSSKIIDMIGKTGSQSDYGHDKKAAAVPDLKYSLSPEVQATIENIAAATKTTGESRKSLAFPSKNPGLEALLSTKGKTGETKDNAKGHEVKVTAPDNNKSTSTSMKYNGEMVKEFDAKSQAAVTSEPHGQTGLKRNLKESGRAEKSSIKPVPIPNNTSASIPTEQINNPEEGKNTVKTGLPDYVIHQVGRQIRKSVQDGKSFIKLQLKPPELGSIKIELRIEDNSLRLRMITQDNSVKYILLSNLNELKESLLDQGIKPEKIDIEIDYKPDQSLDNPNKHSGKHGEGEKLSTYTAMTASIKDGIKMEETDTELYNRLSENHVLNLMV